MRRSLWDIQQLTNNHPQETLSSTRHVYIAPKKHILGLAEIHNLTCVCHYGGILCRYDSLTAQTRANYIHSGKQQWSWFGELGLHSSNLHKHVRPFFVLYLIYVASIMKASKEIRKENYKKELASKKGNVENIEEI